MAIDNPFIPPDDGLSFTVGKSTTIEWNANTDGKVTLFLRHANGGSQWTIAIAENIKNTGEYTWTPPSDLEPDSGQDADTYTILIGPDADDPNSVTNQVLVTISGSGSGSGATKTTKNSPSSLSTATLSTSTKEDATVTLTVTGGAGASTSTTTGTKTLPEPSATSGPSPPAGDSGTGGLSSGEKAGIGVGVGVGVPVILVFLGVFIWKRRKRRNHKPVLEESEKAESEKPEKPSKPVHELSHDGAALHELSAKERLELAARERLEIGEGRTRHELPADEKPAELDGHSKVPDEKSPDYRQSDE